MEAAWGIYCCWFCWGNGGGGVGVEWESEESVVEGR